MRALMLEVPPDILAWRKRRGADRWDEMWKGVLHMAPAPNATHQDLQGQLYMWLRNHWAEPGSGAVFLAVNVAPVGGWPHDYRVPDLILLSADRLGINRGEYFEGAPTAVVEILSPEDETMEKLPFYAGLPVPEVWIVDRDTRVPRVLRFAAGDYGEVSPDASEWLASPATGVRLRAEPDETLAVQLGDKTATRKLLTGGAW
jgi:Uma2 family endonuclease